jgi:hypothetical protein
MRIRLLAINKRRPEVQNIARSGDGDNSVDRNRSHSRPTPRFEMITKWSSRAMNLLGDVGSKQWTPSIFLDTLDVGFSAAQRHTQREAEGT